MGLNRHTFGAVAATAAVLVGAGAALAASPGTADRSTRCDARLARIAERRGVTVEQLAADVKARLLARIDAAEKAGRLSSERAATLREHVAAGEICGAVRHRIHVRVALHGMLRSAARFLGLDREELREQLPGTSLAALAEKQGKSASALEAAMVAPAKARLAKGVTDGKLTQARADALLEQLAQAAHRLAAHVFAK
jgi:hypothetical protein